MTDRHQLRAAAFTSLCAGGGDSEAMRVLRAARISRRLLQLRGIQDLLTGREAEVFAGHLRVLADAQRDAPGAVAELVAHPAVGVWAARCLGRLRGDPATDVPRWADLGEFGAVVAVAAHRAGLAVRVEVPLRDGVVALPTLGVVRLRAVGWSTATVRTGMTGLTVERAGELTAGPVRGPAVDLAGGHSAEPAGGVVAGGPGQVWRDARRLRGILAGVPVVLDVGEPESYGEQFGAPVLGPLSDSQHAAWEDMFGRAFAVLDARHPALAANVAADLVAVVPLRPLGGGGGLSATSRDNLGAIALTTPGDATGLAATLAHETQHSKLDGLHSLVPLFVEGGAKTHYSPWRRDPRPVEGLLHGVYAFFAVAEFWRAERDGDASGRAGFEFAYTAHQVRLGHALLRRASGLLPAGRRVVTELAPRIRTWRAEPVAARVREVVDDLVYAHRAEWRIRNIVPDPAGVERLAKAWLAGEGPTGWADARVSAGGDGFGDNILRVAAGHWVDGPAALRRWAEDGDHDRAAAAALVDGRHEDVLADRSTVWAAVAARRLDTGRAVVRRPEQVQAVARWIGELTGALPGPAALGHWLDGTPG